MALWLLPRHKQLAHKGTSETCCVKCSRAALCFQELYKMCVTGFWEMTARITASDCAMPWSQNNLINGSVYLPLKRWSKKKQRLHFKPMCREVPSRAEDTFNKQTIKWWGNVSSFVLRADSNSLQASRASLSPRAYTECVGKRDLITAL